MKGQVRIEFIFGVVIFAVIMFYMSTQLNNVFSTVGTDSYTDMLKQRSVNVMRYLVEDAYVDEPYHIDKSKLIDGENKIGCNLLDAWHLGTYRLKVYDDTSLILVCGSTGITHVRSNIIKFVEIDGGYGNITLEMW